MKNIIQIAGVIDLTEADMLIDAGVDWLGFPFRLPVNKEDLPEAAAAQIITQLKSPHAGVLITYLNTAEEILALCRDLNTQKVQVHGPIALSELRRLRDLSPELFIMKSLVVMQNNLPKLIENVEAIHPFVDAFITDTHDPDTGADGATGKTHDWGISRKLVEISPKPVILAGGLKAENVREAIITVRPAGVDAHTGVENSDGRKSRDKIEKFVSESRLGFAEITT